MGEHNLFSFMASKSLAVSFVYTGASTTKADLDLNREELSGVISLSMPQGIYQINGQMAEKFILLSAKTPTSHHELNAHVHKHVSPINKTFKYEATFKSTCLPSKVISLNMEGTFEADKKVLKQSLVIGPTTHSLSAEYAARRNNINLLLDLETSLFGINKLSVSSDISTGRIIKANTSVTLRDVEHSFDIRLNKADQKISCVIKSPLLKGETMKVESGINGNSNNFDFNALMRFDGKTHGTKFNFRNTEKIYGALEVKTPYRGYRKMNFIASYEQKDKIIVSFNANNPLKIKFDMVIGKDKEGYTSTIEIVTPIKGYENISAKAVVPINRIGPKICIKVLDVEYSLEFSFVDGKFSKECRFGINLGGEMHRVGGSIRYKAPYELSYYYNNSPTSTDHRDERFHIMTDTS